LRLSGGRLRAGGRRQQHYVRNQNRESDGHSSLAVHHETFPPCARARSDQAMIARLPRRRHPGKPR
jgi:hypothetical protein